MTMTLAPMGNDDEAGFRRVRGSRPDALQEAERRLDAVMSTNTLSARARFQEAMATADLRDATFEILDRETLQRYEALPATWTGYAQVKVVNDFRPVRIVDLLGGREALDKVPELTPYPERTISKGQYSLQVSKYGARFAFSWEAWLNDELGELDTLPESLAVAARETESRVAATLLTDGDGPNDEFFKTGITSFVNADGSTGSNLFTGNPELSLQSLTDGITAVMSRRELQGRPITVPRLTLVVSPALAVRARTILGVTTVETQVGAGAGQTRQVSPNVVAGLVELQVEPFLSVVDRGANSAKTWYLVPTPSSGRPSLLLGKLRGHEQPQLRVKSGQGMNVGGGAVPATEGTFEIDDIQYRVRHVLGSGYVDPIGTLASTGAGS